jgi:prepilin-type processing-associated H-X9-DG protein
MYKLYKKSFSLTEILVVVVILSILMAILIPVLIEQRKNAHKSYCINSIYQITHSVQMYVHDYDGVMIPVHVYSDKEKGYISWIHVIENYIKVENVPFCPARERPGQFSGLWDSEFCGYALNLNLINEIRSHDTGEFLTDGIPDSGIRFPSTTVLIGEARTGLQGIVYPDFEQEYSILNIGLNGYEKDIKNQKPAAFRHSGRANYSFLDGHVKNISINDFDLIKNDGIKPSFHL